MAPSSWWIIRIGRLELPCWFPQQMQIGLRRDARNDDEHLLLHLSSSRLFISLIFFLLLLLLLLFHLLECVLFFVMTLVVISVVRNFKNPIRKNRDRFLSFWINWQGQMIEALTRFKSRNFRADRSKINQSFFNFHTIRLAFIWFD